MALGFCTVSSSKEIQKLSKETGVSDVFISTLATTIKSVTNNLNYVPTAKEVLEAYNYYTDGEVNHNRYLPPISYNEGISNSYIYKINKIKSLNPLGSRSLDIQLHYVTNKAMQLLNKVKSKQGHVYKINSNLNGTDLLNRDLFPNVDQKVLQESGIDFNFINGEDLAMLATHYSISMDKRNLPNPFNEKVPTKYEGVVKHFLKEAANALLEGNKQLRDDVLYNKLTMSSEDLAGYNAAIDNLSTIFSNKLNNIVGRLEGTTNQLRLNTSFDTASKALDKFNSVYNFLGHNVGYIVNGNIVTFIPLNQDLDTSKGSILKGLYNLVNSLTNGNREATLNDVNKEFKGQIGEVLEALSQLSHDNTNTSERLANELKNNDGNLTLESSKQDFLIYLNHLQAALKQDFDIDIQNILDSLYGKVETMEGINVMNVINSIHMAARDANFNPSLVESTENFFSLFSDSKVGERIDAVLNDKDNLAKNLDSFDDFKKRSNVTTENATIGMVKKQWISELNNQNENNFYGQLINILIKNNPRLEDTRIIRKGGDRFGKDTKKGKYTFGTYTKKGIEIASFIPNISNSNISFAKVIFHEFMHAATIEHTNKDLNRRTENFLKEVRNAIQERAKLKHADLATAEERNKAVREELEAFYKNPDFMGLLSPQEFYADLFRSPQLVKMLYSIDRVKGIPVKKNNIFTKLFDLLARFFGLTRGVNRINESALGQGLQLLSDSLLLNSPNIRSSVKSLASFESRKSFLDKIYSKDRIYKSITNDRNVEHIQNIIERIEKEIAEFPIPDKSSMAKLEKLSKVYKQIISDESSAFGTISKFNKFVSHMAMYSNLNDGIKENINVNGVYQSEFIDAFISEFINNPEAYTNFELKNSNILFDKKYQGLFMLKGKMTSAGVVRINGRPMALIKAGEHLGKNAYLLVHPDNRANYKKNNEAIQGEIVYLKKDRLYTQRKDSKGRIIYVEKEGDIDVPLNYRVYNRREYNSLRDAYNNNDIILQDRINLIVDNFIGILNQWESEFPTLSRQEIIQKRGIKAMIDALTEIYEDEREFAETDYEKGEYEKIIGNLELLIDTAIGTIENIEGIKFNEFRKTKKDQLAPTEESEKSEAEIEELENDEPERYLMRQDSQSIFDRLSKEVMKELHMLKYPSDNLNAYDDLGMLRTVPVEESKDALLDSLRRMNSPEELIPRLEAYLYKYPFLSSLVYKLKNDPNLRIIFHNNFNLFRVKSMVINEGTPFAFSLPNNLSDRNYMVNSWKETLSRGIVVGSSFSMYSQSNKISEVEFKKGLETFKNKKERFDELIEDLRAVDKSGLRYEDRQAERQNIISEIPQLVSDLFRSIGVNIPAQEIATMYAPQLKSSPSEVSKVMAIPNQILNILDNISQNTAELHNLTNISLVQRLSKDRIYNKIYNKYKDKVDFGGEATTSVNGTSHYLNRTSSYIGRLIKKINIDPSNVFTAEQRAEFFNDRWGKFKGQYSYDHNGKVMFYGTLLNDLYYNKKDAANQFEYYTLLGYNGKQWKNLEANDVLKLRFAAYANFNLKSDYSYFMLPTLSDSPEIAFMKMRKFKDGKGAKNTAQNQIIDNIYDLALAEVNRINFIRRQKELEKTNPGAVNSNVKIDNFYDNGDKFIKFPFLNELIKEDSPSTEELFIDPKEAKELIKNYLDSRFSEFLKIYQEEILNEDDETEIRIITPKILDDSVNEDDDGFSDFPGQDIDTTQEGLEKILKDYFYNDYNATAEILNFLGTDASLYKNGTDFQKRFKEIYASGVAVDTDAMYQSYNYDVETDTFTEKSSPELVGKKTRKTLVVKDLHKESNVPAELLRALEKAFPVFNERIDVAKELGIYNRVNKSVVEDGKSVMYNRFLNKEDGSFSYTKAGEQITKAQYDKAKGIEKFFFEYADPNNPTNNISFPVKKLNLTDGQTLISMNEFRAISVMAGKHSKEMERAYVAYKATGDATKFNAELNNIKSFYYGDEHIPTGDPHMPFIKNNVQFKHAESVAMMYSLVKESPFLSALSEFLNEGFFDNNKSHDIDAISFDSTQKVGHRNVIELDINASKEEIMLILREAAKESPNKGENKYIVTEYENYVIQQPTKNHIQDNIEQSIGTQIRNINISNIPNDAKFNINGKELNKEEYVKAFNTLVNKKIFDNFVKLKERFSDNKALSDLFIETIESNNRYSNNLKDYFTLNKEGEFEIPLFSPQNSILVHQMIMSIIGKNIIKHKIRGGKVINNTNIGYSDNLKIIFENDVPTYFEVGMPFYGTQEQYDAMLDEDGNFDMSRVDEKLLTSIFYRIPTEGYYSGYPVKVKFFFPPSQGVNIVFPSELSSLSGIDFDIDAMYGFLYDYYVEDTEKGAFLRVKESSNIDQLLYSADEYILEKSLIDQVNRELAPRIHDVHLDNSEETLKAIQDEFNNFDEYSDVTSKVDKKTSPLKQFRLYTGDAVGSDSFWIEMGKKYGLGTVSAYKASTMNRLNDAQREETENAYQQAARDLNRPVLPADTYRGRIVRRNYLQAKGADSVFAIGKIVKPGEMDNGYKNDSEIEVVSGGTGYAVQMAINLGKPVYIFDQQAGKWFTHDGSKFVETDTPTLTPNFAGIGSRQLNRKGVDAIVEVYDKTFEKLSEENAQGTPITEAEFNEMVENGEITYTDENGELCAEQGLTTTVKGTKWKIAKDFRGHPKHTQGGVDITLSKSGVTMRRGGKDIKAKFGLIIANKEL